MANFIDRNDYDATVHQEILDSLTRKDEAIIEICEDRAIAEMQCYLSRKYDVDALFSAQGDKRNQLVLMMAIDIAVYHIFSIHNPMKIATVRKDRYNRAKEWLIAVADEKITIANAPLLPTEEQVSSCPFMMSSNPKRNNHM
ncbi:MAG: phage protein Gp36 family protein [Rikenellaceae bacterium]